MKTKVIKSLKMPRASFTHATLPSKQQLCAVAPFPCAGIRIITPIKPQKSLFGGHMSQLTLAERYVLLDKHLIKGIKLMENIRDYLPDNKEVQAWIDEAYKLIARKII